jgi:hypothetical protein
MPYYWFASDLGNILPQPVLGVNLVTGSSYPISISEFDTVIGLVEGEFHAAVAEAGYGFPISTAASIAFNYAKKVVSDGAQAYVLERIGGTQTAAQLRKAYDEALAAIRSGKVTLLGAGELGAEGGRQLPRGAGIASPFITSTWMP